MFKTATQNMDTENYGRQSFRELQTAGLWKGTQEKWACEGKEGKWDRRTNAVASEKSHLADL